MRHELGTKAEEVRREVTARADELATKAKDEWVPIFQTPEGTNGHADAAGEAIGDATATFQDAATEAAAATGEAAEEAAGETAEAINESFDSVDREPTA
jgi:hypothetical protein